MKIDSDPPRVIPVFPLTGTLLLPGTLLPLNVFEERYRKLVADALAADSILGMVQPLTPALDPFGPVDDPEDPPALQRVGCLGYIDRADLQPDGRYQIVLRGVRRFRVIAEEPPVCSYRRLSVDWTEYTADGEEAAAYRDPRRVLAALGAFAEKHDFEFDLEALRDLSGVVLVNALSSALPFSPLEKQALLEAPDIEEREGVLLALMGMAAADPASRDEYFAPPIVN